MPSHPSRRSVIGALATAPIAAVVAGLAARPAEAQQPHMQAAKDALQSAISHLEQGSNDKGGHRVAALKSAKDALEHVEKGIRFDRRN